MRPEENASLFVLHAELYLGHKSRRLKLTGHATRTQEEKCMQGFRGGKLKARVCWVGLGVDVRMLLQLILGIHEYLGERY
jgi:hypothetical protein